MSYDWQVNGVLPDPEPGTIDESELLVFDSNWQPNDIEACLRFPREYALAQPTKFPISYRLRQKVMHLTAQQVSTGPEGVDFAEMPAGAGLHTDELAMVFVCRTCGVTPLEYWRAVYSDEYERYADHVRLNERKWWDDYQRRYREGEFRLDADTYLRMGWALKVVFKEKFDAAVERWRVHGS